MLEVLADRGEIYTVPVERMRPIKGKSVHNNAQWKYVDFRISCTLALKLWSNVERGPLHWEVLSQIVMVNFPRKPEISYLECFIMDKNVLRFDISVH